MNVLAPPAAAEDSPWRTSYDCSPLTKIEQVTVGTALALSVGTPITAEGAGRYTEEKLSAKTEIFPTTQNAVALVAAGKLDAAVGGLSSNVFNSIANGIPLAVVAAYGQIDASNPAGGFMVRTDLLDSGTIRTMKDLKGRTVAFPGTVGSPSAYLTELLLAEGDVTYRDIKHVNLGYSDMLAAFQNQRVDAAYVAAPFKVGVEQSNVARPFGNVALVAGQSSTGILFGTSLLRDRPQVACALLRAHLKTARMDLAPGYSKRGDIAKYFVEIGKMPETLVRSTPEYRYDPELAVSEKTMAQMQRMFIADGVLNIPSPLPYEKIVPLQFRKAVLDSMK
ncbi:ABC transporter substrate-binding protein [Bradyrhizobium sp. 1]|uniref:ABC transporter substrate-binding protein n=1 Tax=Bradyrhizobium sp. 1 TaxID=241591 RepID=UPI001FFA0D56|nr:ABC transporter substrate-binding protein [Bradyrhizobium sp. 1]MCK1395738.1 ABC transporter substrate-binding protein [Bradyrhizobium sp. 1]